MALIKCPDCGNEISEFAEKCPHCGYIVKDRIKKCDECGNSYDKLLSSCPKCGFPNKDFKSQTLEDDNVKDFKSKNKKSHKGLIICLIIILVLAIGLTSILIYYKNYAKNYSLYSEEHTIDETIRNLENNGYIILLDFDSSYVDQTFDKNGKRYWEDWNLSNGDTLYNKTDFPIFTYNNKDKYNLIVTNQSNNYEFLVQSDDYVNGFNDFFKNDLGYLVQVNKDGNIEIKYSESSIFSEVSYEDSNYDGYIYTISSKESLHPFSNKASGDEEIVCVNFLNSLNDELKRINVSIKDIVNLKDFMINNYLDKIIKDINYVYINVPTDCTLQDVINSLEFRDCEVTIDDNMLSYSYNSEYVNFYVTKDDNGGSSVVLGPYNMSTFGGLYCKSDDDGQTWDILEYQGNNVEAKYITTYSLDEFPQKDDFEEEELYNCATWMWMERDRCIAKLGQYKLIDLINSFKNS